MDKATEEKTPTEEKHSVNIGALILWPLLILIFYVLSIGPAVMLAHRGTISLHFLQNVYRPVIWLYDDTPLHKPLGVYLHLWAPSDFDKKGDVG